MRAGRMEEAEEIGSAKADLANLYVAEFRAHQGSKDYLSEKLPDVLHALRQRHDLFQALIQINLTVLAATHAAPGAAPAVNRASQFRARGKSVAHEPLRRRFPAGMNFIATPFMQ